MGVQSRKWVGITAVGMSGHYSSGNGLALLEWNVVSCGMGEGSYD